MKKIVSLASVLVVLLALTVSCEGPEVFEVVIDGYFGATEVSVPAGTQSVFVHYQGADGTAKVITVPVTPAMPGLVDGRDPEPFGVVEFLFNSEVQTKVSVSTVSNLAAEEVYVLEDFPVDKVISSTVPATKSGVVVTLDAPAAYVTADLGQTFYHSSGVVMFEDRWPVVSLAGTKKYRFDYNDVVVDYDIEAVTVPDGLLASEGWREQVKVVLHVRALGGDDAWRVGLILEGFDQKWVDEIVEYKTLDSWQNEHGSLPQWTKGTLQENSLHYEGNPLRPCVEIGGLQRINGKGESSKAGTEVYNYVKDGVSTPHVFNPGLKQYEAWGGSHDEQFDPSLKEITTSMTFDKIQQMKLYNTIPGYVNVAGGLYTYTVIYKSKNRKDMNAEDRAACLKNMLDAVVNTDHQNFYIVNQDWRPIHLKGYKPGDFAVKGHSNYVDKYNQMMSEDGVADLMDPNITYVSKDGLVWGVKCPTLTKHVWEQMYFGEAYPNYIDWIESKGEQNKDWYAQPNGKFLSCWW